MEGVPDTRAVQHLDGSTFMIPDFLGTFPPVPSLPSINNFIDSTFVFHHFHHFHHPSFFIFNPLILV